MNLMKYDISNQLVNQALTLSECKKKHELKFSINTTEIQHMFEFGSNVKKLPSFFIQRLIGVHYHWINIHG